MFIVKSSELALPFNSAAAYKMCVFWTQLCTRMCEYSLVRAVSGYSMFEALKVPCILCQDADAVFIHHITHQLQ